MLKPEIIVICGPTASGKTSLGIELAKKINGEIISADSMQIYKEMNIGTAKPSKEEQQNIEHYLLDFKSPDERYSVADFNKDAKIYIEEILNKGKKPIIVGGTGLYIDSLINGIAYKEITYDEKVRKKLEKEAEEKGLEELYLKALEIDKEATQKISKNDKKRILRILEIYYQTGKTKTQLEKLSKEQPNPYNFKMYALNWDRNILYDRINKRVDIMIKEGLIEEVKQLKEKYNHFPTAMQGLGYKEVVEYLEGKIDKEEMIEKIKKETRHYAKRQLTWFRRYEQITWLEGSCGIQNNLTIILEGKSN